MNHTRQQAGQRTARAERLSLAQDEGSVRQRFRNTLTDDPVTRERYYKWLADYIIIKSSYDGAYRGVAKGRR